MDYDRIFKLKWALTEDSTGKVLHKGEGTYFGRNLLEAQEDAFNTLLNDDGIFNPDTMSLVFSKDYQEAEI